MAPALCFIVNVRSGRAARALAEVRAFAAAHDGEVVLTERARHGYDLAAAAIGRGVRTVVAVGGDGTLNEVASALVGTETVFGLVPCGSGDGLGRHLRIHGSTRHALSVLAAGRVRAIDSGTVDGKSFFTAAGIGFEAEIAARFNRLERRGFWRYLTTSAATIREWRPQSYRISHDGQEETIAAFTLAVANSDQYGNGARIAPGARVDDGRLNLTAIGAINALNAGPLLARLFAGHLVPSRGVLMRNSTSFVVERAEPGPFHTDGELHQGGRRLEFRVHPASLRVIAP